MLSRPDREDRTCRLAGVVHRWTRGRPMGEGPESIKTPGPAIKSELRLDSQRDASGDGPDPAVVGAHLLLLAEGDVALRAHNEADALVDVVV